MIDYVEAQVEKCLVAGSYRVEQSTDIEFQLIKNALIDNAVAVDKTIEKGIFSNSGKVLFGYLDRACA